MKALPIIALIGCLVILFFLTAVQWVERNYWLVAFGCSLMVLAISSLVSVIRSKDEETTAEQLRDSDELYNEAAIQFIETQMERKTKFWVAVVIGILLIASFVICVMWAGFKA